MTPLIVGRPTTPASPNAGVGALDAGSQPWSAEGGRVNITLVGDSGTGVPISVRLGNRPARQALGHAGKATSVNLSGGPTGWWELSAELDPDELRADDRRVMAVRVAALARVNWDSTGRHVAAACEVLASNHRIARGQEAFGQQDGPEGVRGS